MRFIERNNQYILISQNKCPGCHAHWETPIPDISKLHQFVLDLEAAPACDVIYKNNDPDLLKIQRFEGIAIANIFCYNCYKSHWAERIDISIYDLPQA